MKKTLILFIACALMLSSCGFFGGGEDAEPQDEQINTEPGRNHAADKAPAKYKAAIILPDGRGQNWVRAAESIGHSLEELGYGREVYFANGDSAEQAELIRYAVNEFKANCIIIAPVDSYSEEIISAVEGARTQNVSVIAYDRLIMNTDVDCYIAYDPYLSGRLCAQSVESAIDYGKTPSIEILLPNSTDASAQYFYYGAMDVLLPQIDAGRIVVPSGRTSFEQTSIEGCTTEAARGAMAGLLKTYYGPAVGPDAVLTPDDALALGVIEALEDNGCDVSGAFPIVTGGGCYLENMHKMIDGKQYASLLKDEREIADTIASTVDYLTHGISPDGADRTLFNNGNGIVPSFTEEPVPVNIDNYKELLIGGDYYSYKELNQ